MTSVRPRRSHYVTLSVPADASADSIREAYRRLAREYHPDRQLGSAAGADRMPEVNEAYRVLSDPVRRAVYDAELRNGGTGGGPGSLRTTGSTSVGEPGGRTRRLDDHDDDYAWRLRESQRPIRVPWRTIAVCAVALIGAIVVLAQFTDSAQEPAVDNIMRVGDCAAILPDGRAQEVPCSDDGAGDLVVQALIPFDRDCRNGYLEHRDRQGMGNVCLEQR
ncbi:MAG: J domain-containing protein [Actinomycetota bacterium]